MVLDTLDKAETYTTPFLHKEYINKAPFSLQMHVLESTGLSETIPEMDDFV